MSLPVIGIIGAGKLGITLAQLARKADYEVLIAGSSDAEKIRLSVNVLAPGTTALTATEVAVQADIVILALPLGQLTTFPRQELAGKLVIDAMNHWWEVDGPRDEIIASDLSSSQAVQQFLGKSRVVKALNHIGYHHLHDEPRGKGETGRKAIAIAGNNHDDIETVAALIDTIGFDPLPVGELATGKALEPGRAAFGANLPKGDLRDLIANDML